MSCCKICSLRTKFQAIFDQQAPALAGRETNSVGRDTFQPAPVLSVQSQQSEARALSLRRTEAGPVNKGPVLMHKHRVMTPRGGYEKLSIFGLTVCTSLRGSPPPPRLRRAAFCARPRLLAAPSHRARAQVDEAIW